jgi:hypothetical protein
MSNNRKDYGPSGCAKSIRRSAFLLGLIVALLLRRRSR